MIFATTILTGLTTAMLRSAFAVIIVAFLIGLVFMVAFLMSGTSFVSLLISIAGFNTGLIAFAAAHIIRAKSASN